MGRASTIDEDRVRAVIGARLASAGTVTLQDVVTDTGVSVGSLYHRYGSREGLLAETWLDAVRAFHAEIVKVFDRGGDDVGLRAALATPRFCREQRDRAIVLACCRQSEFASDKTPAELRAAIAEVNIGVEALLTDFARREHVPIEACQLAIAGIPLAAVRLYLPNQPVPDSIDVYVIEAFNAVMRRARQGD